MTRLGSTPGHRAAGRLRWTWPAACTSCTPAAWSTGARHDRMPRCGLVMQLLRIYDMLLGGWDR